MSDYNGNQYLPWCITSWSFCSVLKGDARALNLSPNGASSSWPAANLAVYIPFYLSFTYPVKRFFWGNGATVAGNSSMAIMSEGGARIKTTGAIANSGASQLQYVATDFILSPGQYWFAYSNDGTTGRSWLSSSVSATFGRHMGMRQQSTAHPIPATATYAAWASTGIPLVGITNRSS